MGILCCRCSSLHSSCKTLPHDVAPLVFASKVAFSSGIMVLAGCCHVSCPLAICMRSVVMEIFIRHDHCFPCQCKYCRSDWCGLRRVVEFEFSTGPTSTDPSSMCCLMSHPLDVGLCTVSRSRFFGLPVGTIASVPCTFSQ